MTKQKQPPWWWLMVALGSCRERNRGCLSLYVKALIVWIGFVTGTKRDRPKGSSFQVCCPMGTRCLTITTVGCGESKLWPLSLAMKPSPFICSFFLIFYRFPLVLQKQIKKKLSYATWQNVLSFFRNHYLYHMPPGKISFLF